MDNFILTYYQKINDGTIIVGKWIRLLYEYIVNGLESGSFFYDAKKAHSAITFIEKHTHHTKGRFAPGLLKLELWQKAAVSVIFGIVDENGNRQFRECVMIMGRKSGKSLFAAGIIENMIYNDDEYGAEVYCCAPKVDQAEIVFDAYWQSVLLDSDLSAITKSRKGDKYVAKTNSSVKKIPFSAKRSDGFNPHMVVCDEIAAWEGDKGLKQYEVLKSALGAREQPLMLSITTANYINDSIYDELMKRSTRFLLGDSGETRLLPFLYMIDDIDKWNDINELQKSNPNLGVSISVSYLLEEIAIAEGSFSKKNEFLTKHCCLKQSSSTAWIPANYIEAITGDPITADMLRNNYAVGGIDLSQTTDLTACVCLVEKNGIINVLCQCFMPREKLDEMTERDGVPYNIYVQRGLLKLSGDNFVDYNDCFEWFRELVETYQIYPLVVGYDRWSSQYLVQSMESYGFKCDDVFQGENLFPVLQELSGTIRDKKIYIGDNDLLKIHLLNSAIKMNNERGRGRLVKINSLARIDSCAALVDAMTVRQKWYGEIGEQLKNE